MKEYPRIKRLSALGIVHHQNFNYEFSPFRTDFVGEGGAGKSMIADLLQLICVGTRAFHSPTKGTGPRKADTMVLRTEGKGTDFGYAFVNIEKAENQHIVIGIYLESSGGANMFIIQDGNNFDVDTQLIPFPRLIGVEDFQRNNSILPINDLKEYIRTNLNLTCESWDRVSSYHKILFNNHILPLDLSLSNKTVDNYAKIIQAFSRESLDISKPNSLQSFLFGDEKEKELFKKFSDTIVELKEDTNQFINNSAEIEALTTKQTQLSSLLKLKSTKESRHKIFLTTSYKDIQNQIAINFNHLRTLLSGYYYSLKSLPVLMEQVDKKTVLISSELEELEPKWEDAFKLKSELDTKIKKRRDFHSWLQTFNCSAETLIEKFEKYHKSIELIQKITELQEHLKVHNLISKFKADDYEEKNLVNQIDRQIEDLKLKLSVNNKLKALNNIDDKHSLAYWALEQPNELSKNQEAIIRKYQNKEIKVEEPIDQSKIYIPNPNDLLSSMQIYKRDDSGFWINLNGIIEFFNLNFDPVFNTKDKEEIRSYFQRVTTTIQNEILSLENEINDKITLKKVFEKLTNPDDYLKAWNSQPDLQDQLETHEMYQLSIDDFTEHSALYAQNLIEEESESAKKVFSEMDSKKGHLKTLKDNLERESKKFIEPLKIQEIENIRNEKDLLLDDNLDEVSFLSSMTNSEDYYDCFMSLYNQEKSKYECSKDIIHLVEKINKLNSEKNFVYSQNPNLFIDVEESSKEFNQSAIDELRENYDSSKREYDQEYNLLVRQHLKNSANRFENTGDFQALCEEILPSEIFNDLNNLDLEVIEKIDKYLKDINLKNKRLNNRKLQKLATIVEEVENEVSDQRNSIRIINNFLNSEDKEITGGHLVSLEDHSDETFAPNWMNLFTENINNDLGLGEDSLFESEKGISNELEGFPSLNEKLLEAFYRSGGSHALKPSVEQLLNPKSYYSVKFSIKTSQGKKNDGSTSQAYAAISLLCIAKLSLLNKQAKNKPVEAIRFMAIDEAEGLGSNFDMLYNIALANDYQILSLSINPNKIDAGKQNIYLLQNSLEDEKVNYDPVPIFGLLN
jgi:hypothetical protein